MTLVNEFMFILLNSGQALAPAEPDVALASHVSWLVGLLLLVIIS